MHSKCGLRFEKKNRGSSYAKLVLQTFFLHKDSLEMPLYAAAKSERLLGKFFARSTHTCFTILFLFLNNVNIYDNKKPL